MQVPSFAVYTAVNIKSEVAVGESKPFSDESQKLFKGRLIMKNKRREKFGLNVFFHLSGQNRICLERAALVEIVFAKTCTGCMQDSRRNIVSGDQ